MINTKFQQKFQGKVDTFKVNYNPITQAGTRTVFSMGATALLQNRTKASKMSTFNQKGKQNLKGSQFKLKVNRSYNPLPKKGSQSPDILCGFLADHQFYYMDAKKHDALTGGLGFI